jgi:hypothetical protein
MPWPKREVVKSLGALAGIAIFIIILSSPSLSDLPIISMLICIGGFAYVAIQSVRMYNADKDEAIKKFEKLRSDRLSEISNNIQNPNGNLTKASRMTLQRNAIKLQANAERAGENFELIEESIKNPNSFKTLPNLAQSTLKNEAIRLSQLPLKAEPEDNAIIVGIGGIFGIISGLGISEALATYFGSLVVNTSAIFTSLIQIVTIDWAYTYRIAGFLAIIIRFIHGFIVTLTAKWYHNTITDIYHFRLAFLFFIAVIIHTVLFFLLALNVQNIPVYILYLWSILIFNILWLLIQSALTYGILKRTDTFIHEWITLNFITVAYISVFIFAYPNLLQSNSNVTVGQDAYLNLQIALVLIFRTVCDYTVGWKKVYNKETK